MSDEPTARFWAVTNVHEIPTVFTFADSADAALLIFLFLQVPALRVITDDERCRQAAVPVPAAGSPRA